MIFKLFRHLREYKKPTYLTLAFMVGEALMETLIPFMTARLINEIKRGAQVKEILTLGVVIFFMAVISLSCGGIAGLTSAKASAGLSKNLRKDMLENIQTFAFKNIDDFSASSLITRMTTDVSNVQQAFMMLIRAAVRSPLMLAFAVTMATIMGGRLALGFVVMIPVMVFGLFLVTKHAMPAFHRVFRKYDRLNESIEENVQAMRVVKGFAREEYEKKKFDKAAEEIRKDFTFAERLVAVNMPLMQLCMYFNWIFVLFFGSRLVVTSMGQSLDVGQISAMLTYGVQVLMSLMMISVIYVMLTISAESARRIVEVLDAETVITNPESPVTEVKDGSIDFENVSFKYFADAEEDTLSGVDLHIRSGMTVGILGSTGSSKSTLVQLIPRLYDVTEGSVKVAGVDVRDYDLETLRESVAMVLQKNLLFAGTIRENLRWGDPDATDEELEHACRLAQADEFIRQFPDGYDTKIEQGGTNVSGGQRQRLCIARALLKKPKILILDDSTSAVDTRTDALIRQGFKEFIPETTKIIIAQRVASVEDADMILIMENGRIADAGSHEELMARNEAYRETYEQQTRGGDADES